MWFKSETYLTYVYFECTKIHNALVDIPPILRLETFYLLAMV